MIPAVFDPYSRPVAMGTRESIPSRQDAPLVITMVNELVRPNRLLKNPVVS